MTNEQAGGILLRSWLSARRRLGEYRPSGDDVADAERLRWLRFEADEAAHRLFRHLMTSREPVDRDGPRHPTTEGMDARFDAETRRRAGPDPRR